MRIFDMLFDLITACGNVVEFLHRLCMSFVRFIYSRVRLKWKRCFLYKPTEVLISVNSSYAKIFIVRDASGLRCMC